MLLRRHWAHMGAMLKIMKEPDARPERVTKAREEIRKRDRTTRRRRVNNPALPRAMSKLSREELMSVLGDFGVKNLKDNATKKELLDIAYAIPHDAKKGETKIEYEKVKVNVTTKSSASCPSQSRGLTRDGTSGVGKSSGAGPAESQKPKDKKADLEKTMAFLNKQAQMKKQREEEAEDPLTDRVLTFGHHNGKMFSAVLYEDPSYTSWAVRHAHESKNKNMSDFVRYVMATASNFVDNEEEEEAEADKQKNPEKFEMSEDSSEDEEDSDGTVSSSSLIMSDGLGAG